jgi:hypothetical protein
MLSLKCKHVQHVKSYIPCNFEVNLITHLWVIGLFSSHFKKFNTFRLIFQKLLEIDVKFKLQKCAACQDLPTTQFWSKSHYPFWSYCPFFIKILWILILSSYISKTIRDRGKVKLQFRVGRSWHAEHVCTLNLTSISYSFWNKGRKVLKCWKVWWKKGINSKIGNGIYFKIAGYVDLDMLHIFAT